MALIECADCGHDVSTEADTCPQCGNPPVPLECWECGKEASREDETCPHCGAPDPVGDKMSRSARRRLKDYYRHQFRKFEGNDGNFAPTWNWPAFFFGPFWYLYRGMWAKALILFVMAAASGGVMWVFAIGWGAVVGNYDYYLLEKESTQLYPT